MSSGEFPPILQRNVKEFISAARYKPDCFEEFVVAFHWSHPVSYFTTMNATFSFRRDGATWCSTLGTHWRTSCVALSQSIVDVIWYTEAYGDNTVKFPSNCFCTKNDARRPTFARIMRRVNSWQA